MTRMKGKEKTRCEENDYVKKKCWCERNELTVTGRRKKGAGGGKTGENSRAMERGKRVSATREEEEGTRQGSLMGAKKRTPKKTPTGRLEHLEHG